MNKKFKIFFKIIKSYIKYYYYLLLLDRRGIRKFKQDFKRGRGLSGILLKTFLTLILKFFLFFVLLGGFTSVVEFSSFLNSCSFLFFPELFIIDFNKISSMEIYKVVAIIFLIIMANIISIIDILEQLKKYRLEYLEKIKIFFKKVNKKIKTS